MHIYKIEISEITPITVIANSFDDAANIFWDAIERAFGHLPVEEFAVSRWKLKAGPNRDQLQALAAEGHRGFVWEKDGTWQKGFAVDPITPPAR